MTRPTTNAGTLWLAPCALAALLVAGCAATPKQDLREPAFAMPERFTFDGTAPREQHWWRAFGDPALNQLVEQALGASFTLRSAYARVEQARATLRAQGAALLPSAEASAEQSTTRRPDSDRLTGNTTGNTIALEQDTENWSDSRTLALTASYEVDLWNRLENQRAAAAFDLQAQRAALQSAAVTLAANVAGNWYRLQELRARIDLLERQIRTNRDVLDLTTYTFKHGQAQAADVLRQRQTVESVRGQLEQTRATAATVEHALAVLVGRAPGRFDPPEGQLVALPAQPETGIPAELLMRRPDVRQQFHNLVAADRRVAVAVADRYPQLSLSATISSTADNGGLLADWITQIAASVTQPLFDGGARAAEVARSQAVAGEALADYQQSMLTALQEVDDALANEYRQQRYIEHLDKQLDLSAEVVENLRLRYLRGGTDYLDVLNALLTRQDLQVERLTARRQLLDFRIDLYRALAGDLGDTPLADQRATDGDANDAS